MVVVPVRGQYSHDLFFFSFEIGDVGNNVVDARHVFFRHAEPYVNDDDVLLALYEHHVAADFTKPSKRDETQCLLRFCCDHI